MATHTESKKKSALMEYFEDSYQELKKVTWPTKNQAIRLTFLVIAVVIVTAILIGILDYTFAQVNKLLWDLAPEGQLPTIEEAMDVTTESGIELGDIELKTGGEETLVETASDGTTVEVPVEGSASEMSAVDAPTEESASASEETSTETEPIL